MRVLLKAWGVWSARRLPHPVLRRHPGACSLRWGRQLFSVLCIRTVVCGIRRRSGLAGWCPGGDADAQRAGDPEFEFSAFGFCALWRCSPVAFRYSLPVVVPAQAGAATRCCDGLDRCKLVPYRLIESLPCLLTPVCSNWVYFPSMCQTARLHDAKAAWKRRVDPLRGKLETCVSLLHLGSLPPP